MYDDGPGRKVCSILSQIEVVRLYPSILIHLTSQMTQKIAKDEQMEYFRSLPTT